MHFLVVHVTQSRNSFTYSGAEKAMLLQRRYIPEQIESKAPHGSQDEYQRAEIYAVKLTLWCMHVHSNLHALNKISSTKKTSLDLSIFVAL
jgi:hypothetical protein